jgi:hypothetical protein
MSTVSASSRFIARSMQGSLRAMPANRPAASAAWTGVMPIR